MQLGALFVLTAALLGTANASTITVEITGTTKAVHIEAGPIFGYKSYDNIPEGTPFVLTYTFEDTRGEEKIVQVGGGLITQSEIASTLSSSPGTNATLQIGEARWEFGASARSQVKLSTSSSTKSDDFVFATQNSDNRISAHIVPESRGFWPKNGDWRASFTATALTGSTGSFSADNGRVTAKGSLLPATIAVSGVDLDGQWLSYTTVDGGPELSTWARQWHLGRPSKKGGYVVEEVTRTIRGTKPDGSSVTPSFLRYWVAWPVAAGAVGIGAEVDRVSNITSAGDVGEDTVSAVARFYEGLTLPSIFASGNSRYAGSALSSITEPNLSTENATLPVSSNATLHF